MQTARLFIALPVPKESLNLSSHQSWRKFRKSLEKKKQPQRWVPQENLHFTLKFLGEVELERLSQIQKAIKPVAQKTSSFILPITGAGAFPEVTEARVVWLGVKKKKRLVELAEAVNEALTPLGLGSDEEAYTPHLTVVRLKSLSSVKSELDLIRNTVWCDLYVNEIGLYRSDLRGAFPHYTQLISWPLEGGS